MVVPAAGGEATRLSDLQVEDPGRYSPDGKTVLTSAGGRIVMLDTTGREVGEIVSPVPSCSARCVADGDHVAYSGTESGVFSLMRTSLLPVRTGRIVVSDFDAGQRFASWGSG